MKNVGNHKYVVLPVEQYCRLDAAIKGLHHSDGIMADHAKYYIKLNLRNSHNVNRRVSIPSWLIKLGDIVFIPADVPTIREAAQQLKIHESALLLEYMRIAKGATMDQLCTLTEEEQQVWKRPTSATA